jgi:hypothetical protein
MFENREIWKNKFKFVSKFLSEILKGPLDQKFYKDQSGNTNRD